RAMSLPLITPGFIWSHDRKCRLSRGALLLNAAILLYCGALLSGVAGQQRLLFDEAHEVAMNKTAPASSLFSEAAAFPFAITARGLVKHFGAVKALDGIDLDVPRGMIFAVLGPNGAGKTTLIRTLATLTKPDAGSAKLMGHD